MLACLFPACESLVCNRCIVDNYVSVETYQVSFFSKTPRHEKLIELRNILREQGLHPAISHEYVEESGKDRKYYHSYFSIELLVDE